MPPKTRTWYDWPRWRIPRRSFARGRRRVVDTAMRRAYGRKHGQRHRQRSSGRAQERSCESPYSTGSAQVFCLVRRQGLEPRTRGLRAQSSPIRCTSTSDDSLRRRRPAGIVGRGATPVAGQPYGQQVHNGRILRAHRRPVLPTRCSAPEAAAVDAEEPAGLHVVGVANVRADDQRGVERRVVDRSCSGR